MKSFCISLEKYKDKWPELKTYFSQNGLPDINIFSGVNGNEIGNFFVTKNALDISEKTKSLIRSHGGVEKIVSTWGLFHLYNKLNRRDHAQLSSWGAIGCAMSHLSIWKKIVDENMDMALIFEDDVSFKSGFKEKLQTVLKNIPQDADAVMLDVFVNFQPLQYDDTYTQILGQFWGLHGYIMTQKGAKKLLEYAFPMEIQLDSYMGFSASLNRVKLYVVKDSLCSQKSHASSIQTDFCVICDVDDKKITDFQALIKNLYTHLSSSSSFYLFFSFCFLLTLFLVLLHPHLDINFNILKHAHSSRWKYRLW